MITACGGGKTKTSLNNTASDLHLLSGVAQKGPARSGSFVVLYALDNTAKRTGHTLITKINGKRGAFAFQLPTEWQNTTNSDFIEVVFTGHFFDESTGKYSLNPIRLSAFSPIHSTQQISINILTTLLTYRVRRLMTQGVSFSMARLSAATSLQKITNISANIASKTDITRRSYPQENAVLLFLSGAIAELSLLHNEPTQRIIDQIATNFAIDGQLSGIGKQWEQRLQQMSLNKEAAKTEKYATYLQYYIDNPAELPRATHLPKHMRITTRPIANAGSDQIVPPNTLVSLDGSRSHDIDNDAVKYVWFQTDQGGNNVPLNNRFIAAPQFIAPKQLNQTLWFTLIVTDKNNVTNTDTIKVSTAEILPTINALPDIVDEKGNLLKNTLRVKEGESIPFSLSITNPLKKDLQYSFQAPASNGTVLPPTDEGVASIITMHSRYSHDGSETQADAFVLRITDARNNAVDKRINVIITPVNDPPQGNDDQTTILMNQAVEINVLANDTDPESDTLSLVTTLTEQPKQGEVSINDGILSYLPNKNYRGEDRFIYRLTDGDKTATATVFITINELPNTPPIANNDSATTNTNQPVVIPVLNNDDDDDFGLELGDRLSIDGIAIPANHGNTAISGNLIIYTPNTGFSGRDEFTYIVSDGRDGEASANVSITVNPINELPIALDDTARLDTGEVIISVLENDSDPDGDKNTLLIDRFTQGKNGVVTKIEINQSLSQLKYTLSKTPRKAEKTAGSAIIDSFTYTIKDEKGAKATATVTIESTIIGNKPPKIVSLNSINYAENNTAIILNIESSDDRDTEGNGLYYAITKGADKTKFGIDSNTGELTFNASPDFEHPTDANGDNVYDVEVTVYDNEPLTHSQLIHVTITNVSDNKAPNAVDDNIFLSPSTPTYNVMENDSDPDGDTISVVAQVNTISQGGGIINLSTDGNFSYSPPAGFISSDTFGYTLKDEHGATNTATVFITFGP
jgi:hypothetical protein